MKEIFDKKILLIFSIILIAVLTIFVVVSNRINVIEKVSKNYEQLTTDEMNQVSTTNGIYENEYITMDEHLEQIENVKSLYNLNEEVVLIKALKARTVTGGANQDFTGVFTPSQGIDLALPYGKKYRFKSIIILTVGSGKTTIGKTRAFKFTDPEGNEYKPIRLPEINPNDYNFLTTTNVTIGASFYPYEIDPDVQYTLNYRIYPGSTASTNETYGQAYVFGIVEVVPSN